MPTRRASPAAANAASDPRAMAAHKAVRSTSAWTITAWRAERAAARSDSTVFAPGLIASSVASGRWSADNKVTRTAIVPAQGRGAFARASNTRLSRTPTRKRPGVRARVTIRRVAIAPVEYRARRWPGGCGGVNAGPGPSGWQACSAPSKPSTNRSTWFDARLARTNAAVTAGVQASAGARSSSAWSSDSSKSMSSRRASTKPIATDAASRAAARWVCQTSATLKAKASAITTSARPQTRPPCRVSRRVRLIWRCEAPARNQRRTARQRPGFSASDPWGSTPAGFSGANSDSTPRYRPARSATELHQGRNGARLRDKCAAMAARTAR